MNIYDLSRSFWNWAYDNPEKIHPTHAAIYFFAIEHSNRLGWKEKFGFPSQMTMDAVGISKHHTYQKYFNDLVDFGFFKLIQKSKNQYSSNIISLKSAMPKKGEALDKAWSKHAAERGHSLGCIDIQLYNKQIDNSIIDLIDTNIIKIANNIGLVLKAIKDSESGGENKVPTEQEVIDYFLANDYTKESAIKAFNFYNITMIETGKKVWRDSNGNVVKNWKQKMRGVWFTEKNKIQADPDKPKFIPNKMKRLG